MTELSTTRRDLLAFPLLAAATATFGAAAARAAGADPSMTLVVPPGDIPWKPVAGIPAEASQQATLFGATDQPGPYMVLVRWSPGFMSAPHLYATDRLCVVVSGTWFVASGADFAPDATVAAPAGSFVRRVARTIHYDGVRKGASEPAVIAITGQGPVDFHLVDGSEPLWRAV